MSTQLNLTTSSAQSCSGASTRTRLYTTTAFTTVNIVKICYNDSLAPQLTSGSGRWSHKVATLVFRISNSFDHCQLNRKQSLTPL